MPENLTAPRLFQPRIRLLTVAAGVQLTYALRTDPAPLTASVSTSDPVLASIEVVVTNDTAAPLDVAEIDVTIDVGAEGTDLVAQTTVNSSIGKIAGFSPQNPGAVTQGQATFSVIATTTPVPLAAGASLAIVIYGLPINTSTGSTTITIAESIGSAPPTPPTVTFEVTKFPYGFFLNDLIVTVPDGSNFTPVAQVAHGTPVTLQWDGSQPDAGSYKIFYSTNAGQAKGILQYANSWTSPALVSDTTFTLTMTAPTSQGGSVSETRSIAVGVSRPDVVASTLSATDLSLSGAVTSALKMNSSATVAGTLGVTGALGVAGTTTLAGLTASGNATIKGDATVSGVTTLAAATISGALTLPGTAQAFGSVIPVALPTAPKNIAAYRSTTDGMLVLSVSFVNTQNSTPFAPNFFFVLSSGIWFRNYVIINTFSPGSIQAYFPVITIPIAANTTFAMVMAPHDRAFTPNGAGALFFPIGQGGKIISVQPPLDLRPPPEPGVTDA